MTSAGVLAPVPVLLTSAPASASESVSSVSVSFPKFCNNDNPMPTSPSEALLNLSFVSCAGSDNKDEDPSLRDETDGEGETEWACEREEDIERREEEDWAYSREVLGSITGRYASLTLGGLDTSLFVFSDSARRMENVAPEDSCKSGKRNVSSSCAGRDFTNPNDNGTATIVVVLSWLSSPLRALRSSTVDGRCGESLGTPLPLPGLALTGLGLSGVVCGVLTSLKSILFLAGLPVTLLLNKLFGVTNGEPAEPEFLVCACATGEGLLELEIGGEGIMCVLDIAKPETDVDIDVEEGIGEVVAVEGKWRELEDPEARVEAVEERLVMTGFLSLEWNWTSRPVNLPTTPSQYPYGAVRLVSRASQPMREVLYDRRTRYSASCSGNCINTVISSP